MLTPVLVAALVAVPVLRMAAIVMGGSDLQHGDYWLMLPVFTTASGGLDLAGILEFHNGHPVVVAKILYWLNLHLFDGSDRTLGLVDIGLVLGQLGLLAAMLRHSALRRTERVAAVVLSSALLFGLQGAWNFTHAMSGTAWLSANTAAIGAVYLRSRDRLAGAVGLAALASISYSTGIAAWPAAFATGISRRRPGAWWREWPFALGGAATFLWYRLRPDGSAAETASPIDIAEFAAAMLGFVFGFDGDPGRWIGYAALAVIVAAIVFMALWSRRTGTSGWVGVATYGLLATMVIGLGRAEFTAAFGLQNRYYSLQALAWIGGFVLLVLGAREIAGRFDRSGPSRLRTLARGPAPTLLLALVLVAGAVDAGAGHAEEMRAETSKQEMREIALRLGRADGSPYLLGGFGEVGEITPVMTETGHHPFTDDWDLACGLLGERVDPADDPPALDGRLAAAEPTELLDDTVRVSGRVSTESPIGCLVVLDPDGTVIGAATPRPSPLGGEGSGSGTFFTGLAARVATYRVGVVPEDGDDPLLLEGELCDPPC